MRLASLTFLPLLLLFTLAGCDSSSPETPQEETVTVAPTEPFTDRVAAAEERLSASDASNKVWRAIEAHGGLQRFYEQSPLFYHFNYRPEPGEQGNVRNTLILNDYVGSRAVHSLPGDPTQKFGFDGKEAWSVTGEKIDGMSPQFWSLTPYYFVGLPFVLADEGITFESLPAAEMDGLTYDMVKVSYGDGMGESPDDYYVLYLNPESGQLDALRYIVSYRGFFPEGEHSPEKLMKITGKTTVEGITLPTGYATHWWNEGSPSEKITSIEVSDYVFMDITDNPFERPSGAKVYTDPVK